MMKTRNKMFVAIAAIAMLAVMSLFISVHVDDSDASVSNYPAYVGTPFSQEVSVILGDPDNGTYVEDVISYNVTCSTTQNTNGSSSLYGLSGILTVSGSDPTFTAKLVVTGTPTITGTVYVNGYVTYIMYDDRDSMEGSEYVSMKIMIYSPEITLTDGSTQVVSGGYLNWRPSISPAGAHLTITQNTTGCDIQVVTSGGLDYLRGTLTDILPGTYYVSFTASASGYPDKSASLAITVPVFVYEPVTDTVPIDTSWQYNLTANPSSSKIMSFTLYKDGTQISNNTGGVTASKTNKVFTFSSSETGTYRAVLLIGATGYTSTTKELVLTVYDSGEITGDPYVESIIATPHASLPGGYYLSAVGAVNYTSLTWDFGDGSSSASGINVIHGFTSNGPSTVTVTAYNSYNGHSYVESASFVVVIENTFYNDAWVGIPYTYTLKVDQADMEGDRLSLVTDAAQSWLSIGLETDSTGSYITLSGTPLSGLADTDLSISVTYDGTNLISYALHIWPAYEEEGDYELSFDLVIDEYTVTLTNTGPSGLGVIMYIDWGSSDIDGTSRQTSSVTATATYHEAGQYRIAMTLVVNGTEYGGPSQFVTVPSSGASFTIVYHANGGSGTMANTSGTSVYVSQNSFVSDGYTFQFWNTNQDGSGIAYSPGASITLASNLNLYAIWTAIDDNRDPEEDNDKGTYITAIEILVLVLIVIGLSTLSGIVPAKLGMVAGLIDIVIIVLMAIAVVFL